MFRCSVLLGFGLGVEGLRFSGLGRRCAQFVAEVLGNEILERASSGHQGFRLSRSRGEGCCLRVGLGAGEPESFRAWG